MSDSVPTVCRSCPETRAPTCSTVTRPRTADSATRSTRPAAVKGNRVENATATIYKLNEETGDWEAWNAADYEQQNPLLTNSEGAYAWLTDEGKFRVTISKEGYETQTSEEFDIPPEKLDLNFSFVDKTTHPATSVTAEEDGTYTLKFSKFMQPETVNTDTITIDGLTDVQITPVYLDEGDAYADTFTVSGTQCKNVVVNIVGSDEHFLHGREKLAGSSAATTTSVNRIAKSLFLFIYYTSLCACVHALFLYEVRVKRRIQKDICRFWAVLLAVMLLFGALPALGVSAAGETEGVTVTATSNFFPTQTVHLSAEELAEKDNKVTVTYCIRSDEPMVNSQWVVTYSDDVLDVLAEDNTDGTASTIMPNAINGSSCNIKPRGESRIVGNCSNFNGYPLTSESGGKTAFVSVTFRVIGTGEANVDLDLYIFSIRVDNNVIPIVDDGSRTDHSWNGERSADVYSGGYTETDSTLFVSLSATNDVAGEQTVTLRFGTDKGIFGYYWGADPDCSRNPFSRSGRIAEELVRSEGTYYATAMDIDGKLSGTVSVTFVKTSLNANGGFVSPAAVLTAKGNSFDLPTPTRSGFAYLG